MNWLQHSSDAGPGFPLQKRPRPRVLMGIVVLGLCQVWPQGGAGVRTGTVSAPTPLSVSRGHVGVCASHVVSAIQDLIEMEPLCPHELMGIRVLTSESLMGLGVFRIQMADGNWESVPGAHGSWKFLTSHGMMGVVVLPPRS